MRLKRDISSIISLRGQCLNWKQGPHEHRLKPEKTLALRVEPVIGFPLPHRLPQIRGITIREVKFTLFMIDLATISSIKFFFFTVAGQIELRFMNHKLYTSYFIFAYSVFFFL